MEIGRLDDGSPFFGKALPLMPFSTALAMGALVFDLVPVFFAALGTENSRNYGRQTLPRTCYNRFFARRIRKRKFIPNIVDIFGIAAVYRASNRII
jgi:hypothetical protein